MTAAEEVQSRKPGRRRDPDPNNVHSIRPWKVAKAAAELVSRSGGKITMSTTVPPYLYDKIRDEAVTRCVTLSQVSREWLEAALAMVEEDKESEAWNKGSKT